MVNKIYGLSCLMALLMVIGCGPVQERGEVPGTSETPDAVAASEEDAALIPAAASLIPFSSTWRYPTILNWRPGDQLTVTVNPPRLSWPYLYEVVAEDLRAIRPNVFSMEISADPGFESPVVRVKDTPYNFYNALSPLPPGTWYWRVGYGPQPDTVWAETLSFVIEADTPRWDRSMIHDAVARLQAREGSRTLPPGTTWEAWNERIAGHPDTRNRYRLLVREAERVISLPWWDDMPEIDNFGRPTRNRDERVRWVRMLREAAIVAFVYRLTGDEQFAGALPRILHMASWPPGGLLSPENLGGQTKMPSQAPELFAAVYDWFRDAWTDEERAVLQEAVRWRIQQMFFAPNAIVWQDGPERMRHFGLAYSAGSHPYQNFAWALPAIMLMAGDVAEADELLALSLNYLTGVTVPDGPDEGYNEGHGYSNEKAGTLLDAALVVEMLLPELQQGRNPAIDNLIDWFAFVFSGPEELPWGDSWLGTSRNIGDENLRKLAMLTGSPLARQLWQYRGRGEFLGQVRGLYNRPWFELMAWEHYHEKLAELPEADIADTLFLPEAGWMFAHSRPILALEDYRQAVGMQFQMRPRGGYGHSFASDGSFVWFAHGSLLSIGGGWRSWASLSYSRSPLSHNSLLINGEGHDVINPFQPQRPYTARPLAFEQTDAFTYWAAELTPGYRPHLEVEEVIRHVLFVEGRWFVILDTLATPEPATFTWLFHVQQDVPMHVEANGFHYEIDGVKAEVRFANRAESIEIQHAMLEAAYVNPVTGKDHFPIDMERARGREEFRPLLTRALNTHSLRVQNREPARHFHFLSVLNAAPAGEALPEIQFLDEKRLMLTRPDGTALTVSFDPARPGDLTVDPARASQHRTHEVPR